MNKSAFSLPLEFDSARIANELGALSEGQWLGHFVRIHYDTGWRGIGVRTRSGDPADLEAGPAYVDTPLLARLPATKELIQSFRCGLKRVRFLKLEPGARIKEHIDLETGAGHDEVRLHVPIHTNQSVEFFSNGERIRMLPGECWFLDASYPHSLYNGGETDRIHLVIDCEVNDWLKGLFPAGFFDPSWRKSVAYRTRVIRYVGHDVWRAIRIGDREERRRRMRLLVRESGIHRLRKRVIRISRKLLRINRSIDAR